MLKIEGLDRIQGRLAEMGRRAEALDGAQQKVLFDDLFPPAFMAEHTEFETLQAMVDASGLFESEADVADVLDGQEWSDFVARRTKFSDWREMLLQATGERTFRQLTDGLDGV